MVHLKSGQGILVLDGKLFPPFYIRVVNMKNFGIYNYIPPLFVQCREN